MLGETIDDMGEGLLPLRTPVPPRRGTVQPVDRAARIAELYEAEFDNVWRSLQRLGVPRASLEDAVHEVFVAAHARLHTFDESRPVRPWLFGIAVRAAAELRRGERRAAPTSDAAAAVAAAPGASPDEALAAREAQALVDEALDQLPFEQRVALVMHDLEEIPAPAIAEALAVPLNTVYSRVRLARARVSVFVRRSRRGAQP
jgi:RNA polymerase sigma-70 factor, ECF subfamily